MSGNAVLFAAWRAAALLRHPRLHWKYIRRMRRLPDVALPRAYSERMLWRKLFDRNPLFVTFADKLATKAWIAARCPDLAIPATLWQGTDPEAIPEALLRPGVVLKANHGSGFNLFLRDPVPPRAEIAATARRWLARDWGRHRGEWHYGEVPRTLFLEEAVGGEGPLIDLQIRAGRGRVGLCSMALGVKTDAVTVRYLDADGIMVPEDLSDYATVPPEVPTPAAFARAVAAARVLSAEVDFARFDFLARGDRLWAGEITVFPAAGYAEFVEPALSMVMGVWDPRDAWFLRELPSDDGWLGPRYAAALRRAWAAGQLAA